MTPQESPAPDESMPAADKADAMPANDTSDNTPPPNAITIPLTDPDLASQAEGLEPGDMLKVESNDGQNLVVSKDMGDGNAQETAGAPEEDADKTGEGDENPAVVAIMAKKMKR
jgi:hypothetical protein